MGAEVTVCGPRETADPNISDVDECFTAGGFSLKDDNAGVGRTKTGREGHCLVEVVSLPVRVGQGVFALPSP